VGEASHPVPEERGHETTAELLAKADNAVLRSRVDFEVKALSRHYVLCKELALILYVVGERLFDLGVSYEGVDGKDVFVGYVLDDASRLLDELLLGILVAARRGNALQLLENLE